MSKQIDKITDYYPDGSFLQADGFDEAIIGVCSKTDRLIYSVSKCIEILEKEMDRSEAIEYFYFNTEGAYVGEKTPIWCEDEMLEQ